MPRYTLRIFLSSGKVKSPLLTLAETKSMPRRKKMFTVKNEFRTNSTHKRVLWKQTSLTQRVISRVTPLTKGSHPFNDFLLRV